MSRFEDVEWENPGDDNKATATRLREEADQANGLEQVTDRYEAMK